MLNFGLFCSLIVLLLCINISQEEPTSLGVHIVHSPESVVAPLGDEVIFNCGMNVRPDDLEWRFRASNFVKKTTSFIKVQENVTREETSSKLRIFVSEATIGEYKCVAWYGSAGFASSTANLTQASIAVDNSDYNESRKVMRYKVAPKNFVIIRCGNVISNPPAIWTFYHNGNRIESPEMLNPNDGAMILSYVSSKDSGTYTCIATNTIISKELKLAHRIELNVLFSDRTAPYLLEKLPGEISVRIGENALLECPGVGSPPPEAVWSSPLRHNLNNIRHQLMPYGLRINNVSSEDQGLYICRLDNGIAPALVHRIQLNVLESPTIIIGPSQTLVNEGSVMEISCIARGNPEPEISWFINGADAVFDNETITDGPRLIFKHVQKYHAGIVQCFAKNELGEVNHGSLFQVQPKQISGDVDNGPLGNVPSRVGSEHNGNKKNKGKHSKSASMSPPSRPNVTRLSDNSVMLRWNVVPNSGLSIQFFKVQYRMLGDAKHTVPREDWYTTNEEIPFGKQDNKTKVVKNFTSSVSGLIPGRFYRFRILAVYSNNDNKEGNTSAKFFLHSEKEFEPSSAKLPTPKLVEIESVSNISVLIHWTLENNFTTTLEGFYAYYRPASSAGDYFKITIDGAQTQKHKIDMLEPDTIYEFKLQAFNEFAASEFSAIKQGKTKKDPQPVRPVLIPERKPVEKNAVDQSNYLLTAGVFGIVFSLLIVTLATVVCLKRRRNAQIPADNKPQLPHMRTDFVSTSRLGPSSHRKPTHHIKSVLPHMNITTNPLAHAGDKDVKTDHTSPLSATANSWDMQPSVQLHQTSHGPMHQNKANFLHHQNTDFFQHHYLAKKLTPTAEYHGLLECAANTLNCRPTEQQNKTSNIDRGTAAMHPTACHGLGVEQVEFMLNNVGIALVEGDMGVRIQPSPKPTRNMIKRNRMGNSKVNMSSGSLDSIEV